MNVKSDKVGHAFKRIKTLPTTIIRYSADDLSKRWDNVRRW